MIRTVVKSSSKSFDFKAEKLTDAAACGGARIMSIRYFGLLTLANSVIVSAVIDGLLASSFHERKVQLVCIPFLRIEWVAGACTIASPGMPDGLVIELGRDLVQLRGAMVVNRRVCAIR